MIWLYEPYDRFLSSAPLSRTGHVRIGRCVKVRGEWWQLRKWYPNWAASSRMKLVEAAIRRCGRV